MKEKIMEAVFLSAFLYGSETWSMETDINKRIEDFEVWVWRRMVEISRNKRETNEEALLMVEGKIQ